MFGNRLNKHVSGSPSRVVGEIPFQTIPWQFKHLRVTQIWSSCADFSSCLAFIDLMAKTNFFLCSGCFIPISCNDNHQQFALPLALLILLGIYKNIYYTFQKGTTANCLKGLAVQNQHVWMLEGNSYRILPFPCPEVLQLAECGLKSPTVVQKWRTDRDQSPQASYKLFQCSTEQMEHCSHWKVK